MSTNCCAVPPEVPLMKCNSSLPAVVSRNWNPRDPADAYTKTVAAPYNNLEAYLNERCNTVIN